MKGPGDAAALRRLGTEQVRPELAHLDELSVADLVALMCADVRTVPDALARAQNALVSAVDLAVDRLSHGGRLIYVGAGTAGRLGLLDAAEAGPTFNVEPGQVVGVMAGGLNAFGVAVENAEDDESAGEGALRDLGVDERDCVVGISASGRTPYVLGAIRVARDAGAGTIGLSCNADTPLSRAAAVALEVVVGPELIAGSTRMNSGTAQKLVLNVLSTATMVRLGKTYGNLMIDVRPTNAKLRDRAARIVAHITGADDEVVDDALEGAQGRPKVAAAMVLGHVDATTAEAALSRHGGRLRPTLEELVAPTGEGADTSTTSWRRLGVGAALVEGRLVRGDVAVVDGRIAAVGLAGAGEGIAVGGFQDNQVNGYAGVDLLHADVEEVLAVGEALWHDGVVAYQPTLITCDPSDLARALDVLSRAREIDRPQCARILGVHLEGPFLSPRRPGTHPVDRLRAPDPDLLAQWIASAPISMVTLAPELDGAMDLIDLCVREGVCVSLGHSAADAAEARAGVEHGARAVTHLFNAMEPLSARLPGLAGVALSESRLFVHVIADGVHVADEGLRLAASAAAGRWMVVTDAIAAAGVDAEMVRLGEVEVHVREGVARRSDGTLAGSVGRLRDSVVRLRGLGLDVEDVLAAVGARPAALIGVPDASSVTVGSPADLLILDDALRITRRVVAGEDRADLA